jgi:hypothetical protein
MSEVITLDKEALTLRLVDLPVARKTFYCLNTADDKKISHLISTIEKLLDDPFISKETVLEGLHNLSFKRDNLLNRLDPENILVMLYFKIKDYKNAFQIMKKYLESILSKDQLNNPPEFAKNHLCLFDLLEFLKNGMDLNQAKKELKKRYNQDIIDEIYEGISNINKLNEYFGIPECKECNNCDFKENCNFDNILTFTEKLKINMKGYDFNQEKIKNYI